MLRFLQKNILDAGIKPETPFVWRNRLRIYNSANFAILLISLLYSVLGLVEGYFLAVAATMFCAVSCVICIMLVRMNYIRAAMHFVFWYGFSFLSFFTLLFGAVTNSYLYFLFMIVAVNLMFDEKRNIILYGSLGGLLLFLNIYFVMNYKPYFGYEKWMDALGYPNIFFVSLLIYLGVRQFKVENLRYARKIEEQKFSLEEKNKEITDSINYARKIQAALLPSESEFKALFAESFLYFRPKDIVSGDFYWASKQEGEIFFTAADCTGHGVPGGFMTMLGISFLDEIINEKKILQPARVLDLLRERIIQTLRQTNTSTESRDGMDLVLCAYNPASRKLRYAAANNNVYVYSKTAGWQKFPCDKQPCGFHPTSVPFSQHEIELEPGDTVFLFSDGYADQFGGPRGKKFKYKLLEELLAKNSDQPLAVFPDLLEENFSKWKGDLEQVDDVLVLGIRA